MKNFLLLVFLAISLNIYAQEDDYCPCEEDENSFDFLNNMMSSADEMIYVPDDTEHYFNISSEMESEVLYIPGEESSILHDNSILVTEPTGPSGIYPVKSYAEAMKSSRKFMFKKRKRRIRTKKYKGGCPVF